MLMWLQRSRHGGTIAASRSGARASAHGYWPTGSIARRRRHLNAGEDICRTSFCHDCLLVICACCLSFNSFLLTGVFTPRSNVGWMVYATGWFRDLRMSVLGTRLSLGRPTRVFVVIGLSSLCIIDVFESVQECCHLRVLSRSTS